MSNELIFYTQLGSMLIFVGTLFGLYRTLVQSKDATIELIREENRVLRNRLEEIKQRDPDVLVERLTARKMALTDEIEELTRDKEDNAVLVAEKQKQLEATQEELSSLRETMDRAKEMLGDLTCSVCGAILVERAVWNDSAWHQGREIDVDREVIMYECGRTYRDGEEQIPCPSASDATGISYS